MLFLLDYGNSNLEGAQLSQKRLIN